MVSKRHLASQIFRGTLIAIAICLIIAIGQPSLAQADFGLKSDIISLKSRLSRLEQQVNRLSSSNSRSLDRTAIQQPKSPNSNRLNISPPVVDGRIIGRSDPLYEKFATLLIELKEDVKNLDRRLTEIEKTDSAS